MFTSKTPWIVFLVLWMGGSTWWHVCRIKQRCADDTLPTAELPAGRSPLTIADGNRFRLDLPSIGFARSSANANLNGMGGSLRSLADYLRANPGRSLTITGYYERTERNASGFTNLGLARAHGIRQYLVQQGGSAASVRTRGQAVDAPGSTGAALTSEGDSLYGGLAFVFTRAEPDPVPTDEDLPGTEEELAAAETFTSVFEPINLYFSLGGSKYIKTPETKRFFDEAARYLAANPDKKLLITGYTDDRGPQEVNERLSRDRANRVRSVLRQWHIPSEQLVVDAKGEEDPRASNDTREGRKANRRVTVVVQ